MTASTKLLLLIAITILFVGIGLFNIDKCLINIENEQDRAAIGSAVMVVLCFVAIYLLPKAKDVK